MKIKFLFITAAFFIFSSAFSQNKVIKDLIGTWAGTDTTNKTGTLKFIDSTNVIVIIPGWGTFNSTFKIEIEKKPMWFDIIVTTNDNVITLKGLLQFVTPDEIKWQITFDEDRSKGFLPETSDNTQLLQRQ